MGRCLCRRLSQRRLGPSGPGCFSGKVAWEDVWEAPASENAQGKAPVVEPPPPEMNVEMAWHLLWEDEEAEQAWRGQDAATLAVVREGTGPLMWGQVEDLGGPS